MATASPAIDWSVFDDVPESSCTCRCGTTFWSHVKVLYQAGARAITRKPCPGCGRDNDCRAIRSDPTGWEPMTITASDVGVIDDSRQSRSSGG